MSDGKKTCLGFGFLIMGLAFAVLSLLVGGVGELVKFFGGQSSIGFNFGLYGAIGILVVFFLPAAVMFISVRDWAWMPAILGGVYAVMPDLIAGPGDDFLAIVAGAVISGLLNYVTQKRQKNSAAPSRPEELNPPTG